MTIGTDILEVVEDIVAPETDILEATEEIMKPGIKTLEVVTTDPEIGPIETDLCLEIEAKKMKRTARIIRQAQEDMIAPEDHMIDQSLLISQETGTETTLITEVLRGMGMIKETGHTAETEEATPRDTEDPVKGIGSLDPPQGTLAEDMIDPEEDTDLPLEVARMTGTAATLGTDPDLGEGETAEEVTAGTTGWTSKLIL